MGPQIRQKVLGQHRKDMALKTNTLDFIKLKTLGKKNLFCKSLREDDKKKREYLQTMCLTRD